MSDLTEALRTARVQFLSLDRLPNGAWEATYRGSNRNVARQARRNDPAAALYAVLTDEATNKSPEAMDDLL